VYGSKVLVAMPQAAYDASLSPMVFGTAELEYLAWDLNVVSFQGGTLPSITFFLDRQTANGDWSLVLSSGSTGVAINWGIDIGPGFATFAAPNGLTQHAVLTDVARLRWTLGGTVPPTTVTFANSIVGRH
jgi:hypothetical protein